MEYVKRSDEEYRRQRKDNLRAVRLRRGALTKTESRDACWTVRHLCDSQSFAQIAQADPEASDSDENKVGKAIRAFRRRTGL